MLIKETYTRDHDNMAGYGGRIGYRYVTVVLVCFDSKEWNAAKRKRTIGGLVVDVANELYKTKEFRSSYNPQVDTKARGKKGVTVVKFEYFHNDDLDAERMNYLGNMKKHHIKYEGASSQWELDPNNKSS